MHKQPEGIHTVKGVRLGTLRPVREETCVQFTVTHGESNICAVHFFFDEMKSCASNRRAGNPYGIRI
jgi:hypothetical protein